MRSERVFYVVASECGVGLTSVSLGLVRALDREGIRVAFFKPVHDAEGRSTPHNSVQDGLCNLTNGSHHVPERSSHFLRATGNFDPPEPLPFRHAENALKSSEGLNRLLEDIVERYEEVVKDRNPTVVVVEGLTLNKPGLEFLNEHIVKAIDAQVILVTELPENKEAVEFNNGKAGSSTSTPFDGLKDILDQAKHVYGERRLVGCVINKLNAPPKGLQFRRELRRANHKPPRSLSVHDFVSQTTIFSQDKQCQGVRLLGAIPWSSRLLNVRTSDMARHLGATVLYRGEIDRRRVDEVCLVARNVCHMVNRLKRDTLIITPSDREDILLAACMAELNGVPLAGVVLTGGGPGPSQAVLDLCDKALKETGLPLLLFDGDSYEAAATASAIDREVPLDDIQRIEKVMDKVASNLDVDELREGLLADQIGLEPQCMSPPAFMHQLVVRARKANRRIVLPEGDEPRVIRAAVECQIRGIARCVLLGEPTDVRRRAAAQGILEIPTGLEIIAPTAEMREKYVPQMVELRKHKGMSAPVARAQLEDITVLATMMLALGEVDGLVSGAIHTTANTIRPALQLIKAREDAAIVSSIFFMLLPDQVVLYGDCAINTHPEVKELASIAIESAESAKAFGIEPRIAMLSYSTGTSGTGSDVERVREATELVRQMRPDLLIDGPLQYDAACNMTVAKSKAPDSPVAGRATVLVFPDLNTGNTTYKAVQRTANVIAVGPMLQGLRRPVNDLSRGALVEDIVYTIALTSIQAEQTVELGKLVQPEALEKPVQQ